MKILGLITARGGSKGIPGKNIKLLGGKPLLAYVGEDALKAKGLDKTIVSTDDESIAEVAEEIGIEVPFLRPADLAADNTPSIDVVKHALVFMEEQGHHFDAICLLQPTSPFKPEGFLDKCIEKYRQTNADCLISVLPVPHQFNPHWIFKVKDDDNLVISTGDNKIIPRRQELPKSFYRDGSVYVIGRQNILDRGTLVDGQIAYMESDPDFYANLDTLDDWRDAERRVNQIFR